MGVNEQVTTVGSWGLFPLWTSGIIHLRVIPAKGQGRWVIFPPISIHHWLRTAPTGFNCNFWPEACEDWAPSWEQRKPSRRKEQFFMKPLTYREDLNVKGHGRAWMTSATDQNWKELWENMSLKENEGMVAQCGQEKFPSF